jgi:AcrR family transcriptional regulator
MASADRRDTNSEDVMPPTKQVAKLEGSARDRLLAAADDLFYSHGIQAVGIDRVIERAGVAKASLYNTFGSKDELVRAYLEQRGERRKERIEKRIAEYEDVRDKMLAVFEVQADAVAAPSFRGCAFLNASAEDPAGETTAREVSAGIRRWLHGRLQELAGDLDVASPDDLAKQIAMLYDGASVAATFDNDRKAPERAKGIASLLIDTALETARGGAPRPRKR